MKIKFSAKTLLGTALLIAGCGSSGISNQELFAQEEEDKISLAVASATQDGATVAASTHSSEQFWVKVSEEGERVFRYGRPGSGTPTISSIRRHNYRIPVTVTTQNGQSVNTGTLTKNLAADLPTGTASRVFALEEIELTNLIAGTIRVDETGANFVGSDVHAYLGGIAASNLPATATTYNGHFYGQILTEGGGIASVDRPVTLVVDFSGSSVTGNLGSDITLAGTLSGDGFSGTATVVTTGITLTNGTAGTFDGAVFGNGAPEAGGIVSISETGGATDHELVGAFGASQ